MGPSAYGFGYEFQFPKRDMVDTDEEEEVVEEEEQEVSIP